MTTKELQDELEKGRAILKSAEEQIAIQNKELNTLREKVLQNKATEEALENANTRLTELISHLQNGIFAVDENRNILVVNETFCRQFGITVLPETLLGTNAAKVIEHIRHLFKNPDEFVARVDQILKDRKIVLNDELKLVNGHIFSRDYIPIFSHGDYKGHLWKYTDITRNKTISDTFDTQRKFYEQILNNIPADIAIFSPAKKYLYVNPIAVKKADLRKWMIGKTLDEYCIYTNKPPDIVENRKKNLDEILATKKQVEWEEKIVLPNGEALYHLRIMYPVLNDREEVEIIIAYGINITERKKIQEQIQLSEKRFKDIFNFSQAWICTHDLKGKLLTINPAACQMLEFEDHELIGRQIDSLIPEKVREQFSEVYLKKLKADGKAEGIMSILNSRGKTLYLLYHNFLVKEPGIEPYVIGFAQNITQRIYAEEALKKSEEKYKGIIENMNLGMIEIDTNECITFANQRFCTMSGYERSELLSKKATDLFLHGASLKRTRDQLSKQKYGINNNYELTITTKDGAHKWWLTSATPVYNADGSLKGTISIHLDITEKKKLEEQLREAKKETERSSKSKDIFLTNMSHEIRTPLNAIMGLSKLLSKSNIDTKQKNYLDGIEDASSNLLGIINDLLDFSKIESGKITVEHINFSLEAIAQQAVNVLVHKADEKGLMLSYEVDKRIAPVMVGDPYRVNQVFMNMLSNAIKFTDKGSVHLKASLLEESNGQQKILVVIQDTGIGIKEDYLKVIFDKFTQEDETVVRKFGGTGLGMSITQQLMELMGGSIKIASKKNVGTTVSLTFNFKIGTSKVIEQNKPVKNDTTNIKGGRILLVEDNALNRLLAYTILTDHGAVVIEAENGLQAVELMREEPFDIVLMDVQMPVMDGIEATRIIRNEIRSNIPILALTANAIKGNAYQFSEAGMNDFIFKPYNETNLVNPIAKWLNKTGMLQNTTEEIEATGANEFSEQAIDEKSLYDLTRLLNLAKNDQVFIIKMLQLFITETSQSILKIKEAYESSDFATVRYYAHRMKPSITNLGIGVLKDDILKIELMKDNDPEIKPLIDKADKVIGLVINQLKAEYNLH